MVTEAADTEWTQVLFRYHSGLSGATVTLFKYSIIHYWFINNEQDTAIWMLGYPSRNFVSTEAWLVAVANTCTYLQNGHTYPSGTVVESQATRFVWSHMEHSKHWMQSNTSLESKSFSLRQAPHNTGSMLHNFFWLSIVSSSVGLAHWLSVILLFLLKRNVAVFFSVC